MKFNFDRAISVTSLLLATAGLITGLTTSNWILFSLAIFLALALPVSFFFYQRYLRSLPPFTVVKSTKTLTILNEGRLATVRKDLRIKANQSGLQYYTHRNISSDGAITGFRNEFGNAPPEIVVRRDAGAWEATTFFPSVLSRNQERNTWLEYEITNGFLRTQERSKVTVDGHFRRIDVQIRSPERPFLEANCVEFFSGMPIKTVPTKFNDNHTVIEMNIRRPKKGAIYQIEWTW